MMREKEVLINPLPPSSNSHRDYVKTGLAADAIDTHALPLLMAKVHAPHPQGHTRILGRTESLRCASFDYCKGGRSTKLLDDPSIEEAEEAVLFLRPPKRNPECYSVLNRRSLVVYLALLEASTAVSSIPSHLQREGGVSGCGSSRFA
jgi:hypothetical protein